MLAQIPPHFKHWMAGPVNRLGLILVLAGLALSGSPGSLAGRAAAAGQTPRTFSVELQSGTQQIVSAAASVGQALAEAGLPLEGLDYSQPPAGSPLPADGKIRLVRVREVTTVEQTPLPFKSDLQPAADLELDTRKVLSPGEYGIQARRVRVRYADGKSISRTVDGEWVVKPPRNQVLGYGTRAVIHTLNTADGTIQYWRVVQMYATSYSPCRIFTDHCDSYTALGSRLQKGIVAMTNAWCRYTCGDKIYVPGYGVGTVADTGGGIPGQYWIDLGYSDNDYVQWNQSVSVYFLAPVPANYQVVLP